jgi:hypothetical protein
MRLDSPTDLHEAQHVSVGECRLRLPLPLDRVFSVPPLADASTASCFVRIVFATISPLRTL